MSRDIRLPLQTLPVFRLAARTQNLRATAEAAHLTHSAVSQQIQLLEARLGFPLFDRRGRRIVLNAAGATLLAATETALVGLEDAVREAEAIALGRTQRLRLTVLPSFAQRWLLPRMPRWRAAHPAITLELHTSQQLVDLPTEGFHAAIRQGAGAWPGLVSEMLVDSEMLVVAAPAVAARLSGSPDAMLAAEPLLGIASHWDRWFGDGGLRVQTVPVATFNDAGMLLQAAELGLGLALTMQVLASDAIASGRLAPVRDRTIPMDRDASTYYLAYPPGLAGWEPLAALRGWLHAEMASASGQGGTPRVSTTSAGRAPSRR